MATVSRLLATGLRKHLAKSTAKQIPVLAQFVRFALDILVNTLTTETCRHEGTDTTALETRPTVRKFDLEVRQNLTEFGQYVAECMPKFVQKVGFSYSSHLVT